MKKEAKWLSSRCIFLVLIELAKKPGTPMDIRIRTRMTKNNYVNIILKRLEKDRVVICLNPKGKIGKVFCINPESKDRIERLFKEAKISQKVNPLPNLNWEAYGTLLCKDLSKQIRTVFKEAYKHGNEIDFENKCKKKITIPALQKEKLPKMATSDIHRTFNRLVELGILKRRNSWPREYVFTEDAIKILDFDGSIIQ
jgi:hypothetical protein